MTIKGLRRGSPPLKNKGDYPPRKIREKTRTGASSLEHNFTLLHAVFKEIDFFTKLQDWIYNIKGYTTYRVTHKYIKTVKTT